MPRIKKETNIEFKDEVVDTTADVKIVYKDGILELGLDLGREDLNRLVDKLNEVIRKVNNL